MSLQESASRDIRSCCMLNICKSALWNSWNGSRSPMRGAQFRTDGSIMTSNQSNAVVENGVSGPFKIIVWSVSSPLQFFRIYRDWLGVLINSNISTYITGSSLIALGLTWWQAVIAIVIGNIIATVLVVLNSLPGAYYHSKLSRWTRQLEQSIDLTLQSDFPL